MTHYCDQSFFFFQKCNDIKKNLFFFLILENVLYFCFLRKQMDASGKRGKEVSKEMVLLNKEFPKKFFCNDALL